MVMSKTEKKKVSFLIVTWNNEDIITDCIDTLFAFSPVENEVIVVDNQSKDRTCDVIRERYGDKVILIEAGANLGFSKANNLALTKASGDYVLYTNPDVIFIEDIVTPMIDVLDANPDVGVVSPMLLNKDRTYQVSTCNFPSASKVFWDDMHFYKLLPEHRQMELAQAQYQKAGNRFVDWTYGAAQLCRYEDVATVGGYPQEYFMYGEDCAFCKSVLDKCGKKTYYLGSSSLIHLGGYSEQQVLNSRKPMLVAKANMYFVDKHYGKSRLLAYRLILFMASLMKTVVYTAKCLVKKSQKNKNGRTKWSTTMKTVLCYRGDLQ
jgi:GT2 family glycosyltransferase